MNKNNRKKLNNKGFTLIELLAVVVILAVVMGIAMTSVLSSMNKSRGGALQDSAMIIANAFNQKYTESLVGGVPSNVYGDVLDTKDENNNVIKNGYNFQTSGYYYIDKNLADTFNISIDDYAMISNVDFTGLSTEYNVDWKGPGEHQTKEDGDGVKNSFVYFDVSTGKFIVCMFANKSGKYYVDNYKITETTNVFDNNDNKVAVPWAEAETMYACSDGAKSWK